MGRSIIIASQNMAQLLGRFYDKHPYGISFFISVTFVMFLLFNVPSLEIVDEDIVPTDKIDFVDFENIVLPKRKVKKEITTDNVDNPDVEAQEERASGISDTKDAIDLEFYSNIVPPKLIGKLRKNYPAEARKLNIEAVVYVELLIGSSGKVRNVRVQAVRLKKQVSDDVHKRISFAFSKAARRMFMGRSYTRTLLNGKEIAIKKLETIDFSLNK